MNSARIIISTLFALALMAAAAWAGPATTDNAKAAPTSMHVMAKSPHAKLAAKATAVPRVDLNSATREELQKLPGVDEAIADKIIAARPFKSRGELRSKGLVGSVEYAKLREHVIAKPTTVAASSK